MQTWPEWGPTYQLFYSVQKAEQQLKRDELADEQKDMSTTHHYCHNGGSTNQAYKYSSNHEGTDWAQIFNSCQAIAQLS